MSELELLLEKHTAEAEAKGRAAGRQEAVRAMREVLGQTWVDSMEISYGPKMHTHVQVRVKSQQRRYVPLNHKSGMLSPRDEYEYLEGPADEVIPRAVEAVLGLS